MKYVSSFLIAFSMYSNDSGAAGRLGEIFYGICHVLFPAGGSCHWGILYGAAWAADFFAIPRQLSAAVLTALPLWISGGIHMDGYMDTKDALSSWGDSQKMLEILKDSHVGAFAVMGLGFIFWLSYGAWNCIRPGRDFSVSGMGFVISRALSGHFCYFSFPRQKRQAPM